MEELTPLTAVVAADPYPYYARHVEERPFYHDDNAKMWVASSAAVVEAVLESDDLRVRPPAEPVPSHLVGSSVSETFGALVRMNDGPHHAALRHAVATAISQAADSFAEHARACAAALADRECDCNAFAHALPVLVVARLLGLPADDAVVERTRSFALAISAGSTERDVATATTAIAALRSALLATGDAGSERASLLSRLRAEARDVGIDEGDVVANAIGLLFQGYDATAGLIGNALVALARRVKYAPQAVADASFLRAFVAEVARYDSPVHNTRRYTSKETTVQRVRLSAGDCVLVVLAAANRDPAANPAPERFDPNRAAPRCYTFGAGTHACPGSDLALTIACTGIRALLARGIDLARLTVNGYRPSGNIRIPRLGTYDPENGTPMPLSSTALAAAKRERRPRSSATR